MQRFSFKIIDKSITPHEVWCETYNFGENEDLISGAYENLKMVLFKKLTREYNYEKDPNEFLLNVGLICENKNFKNIFDYIPYVVDDNMVKQHYEIIEIKLMRACNGCRQSALGQRMHMHCFGGCLHEDNCDKCETDPYYDNDPELLC